MCFRHSAQVACNKVIKIDKMAENRIFLLFLHSQIVSVKAFETWHMRSILHFYHKVQIFSHISKYVSNEKVKNYMLSQCHKYRDFWGLSVLVYFMIMMMWK